MFKKCLLISLILLISTVSAYAIEGSLQSSIDEGYKAYQSKEYKKAVDEFIKVYNRIDDNGVKMNIASYIGLSYRMLDDFTKSNRFFLEAYDYSTKINDVASSAIILGHIADNEKLIKNYQLAIDYYNRALAVEGVNNKDASALYYGLADSYFLKEEYESAIENCNKAIEIATQDKPIEIVTLTCELLIGESYSKLDQIPEALRYFRNSYDRAFVRGYYDIAIRALLAMGDLYAGLNRVNAARAKYEDALAIMLDHNIINESFYSLISFLAEPFFTNHNNLRLGGRLDTYLKNNAMKESYDNRSIILILAGEYHTLSKDYSKGLELFVKAYQEARANNDNLRSIRALTGMAYVNYKLGRSAIANLRIDEAIFRSKSVQDFKGYDELLFIKALILSKNFRMIEAERLLLEAIANTTDDANKIRYSDELKRVQLVAKEDRLKYGDRLDNLTAVERDSEVVEFSINELLTLDNPDVTDDDEGILHSDNMTEIEDEDATREAIEDNGTLDNGELDGLYIDIFDGGLQEIEPDKSMIITPENATSMKR